MKPLWGIDLGGTKIEGVIIKDASDSSTICRMRVPTEKEKGYQHIIHQIGYLVEKMKKETGLVPDSIGVGTPGTTDPMSGLLKNSNTTCLNGQPFHRDLEDHIGIDLKMANDANCFAIAEYRLGVVAKEMPEAKVVFGVIMGTGVGGGLVVNGEVINGHHGIAGEWGHIFLDESGGNCYCGKVGCAERILSGPHLEAYYKQISGQYLSMREIAARSEAGEDEVAVQTIERMTQFFGKGISYIINTIDPDAIILGGGLGNIQALYTQGFEHTLPNIFNPVLNTKFLKPKLGDSAGVFGAALLTA
jgi:predicted NBD/HSP70 family sugar kinase